MQHIRSVHVFEALEDLVQEILVVLVSQGLGGANDLVEVRVLFWFYTRGNLGGNFETSFSFFSDKTAVSLRTG